MVGKIENPRDLVNVLLAYDTVLIKRKTMTKLSQVLKERCFKCKHWIYLPAYYGRRYKDCWYWKRGLVHPLTCKKFKPRGSEND